MRVLTVVGARPQFVKAAPVSRALRARCEEILLHTGQHTDDALSGAFFRDLGLPEPDVRLDLGARRGGERLAAMVRGIAAAIRDRAPDAVLVYGDTDSTLAGALAAHEQGVRLAHVEAGMRCADLSVPEEVNRVATDHLSDLLLAPTESAAAALRAERVRGRVERTGDVHLDGFLAVRDEALAGDAVARLGLTPAGYYLATVHRQENVDDPARLAAIVAALGALGLPVVLPLHPRTRAALAGTPARIRLLEPRSHFDLLALAASARAVLTDSGGLQKEACWLGVPCVTLRERTEWGETVASGWNVPAGAEPARIAAAVASLRRPGVPPDLEAYGGGRASEAVAALVAGLGG